MRKLQLNHASFEDIIYQVVRNEGNEARIDLEKVSFLDPYSLVGLTTIARYCNYTNTMLNLSQPNFNIRSYLNRMNVYSTMRQYIPIDTGFILPFSRNERPLLEIEKIDLNENEYQIITFTELLHNKMDMMFKTHPLYKDPIINRVITSIVEVCQNLEHSGDIGYVAAQKYEHPFKIKIGFMDLGMGITRTLKNKYQKKGEEWSDRRALQLAIMPAVSSRPTGGGFGLSQLTQFIQNQPNSELMIRTGTAKCLVKDGKVDITQGYTYFPGTQISITISHVDKG